MKQKSKKNIVLILRIIFGVVFIYSGLVKAVDPWGSAYKFQEYFHVAGTFAFDSYSLFLSIFQSSLEFVIGFCILIGSRLRLFSWLGFIFMIFYTPITLYLALYNPVTDCGCFGDALHISNYETFWKNIILLVISLILIYQKYRNEYKIVNNIPPIVSIIFILCVSIISYMHLPIIDFRPYKIGTHIESKMSIPEGSSVDEYKTLFIYEKNGEKKEFSLSEIPKKEDGWNFVDQNSILMKKGYEPPIHDFQIQHPEMGDITDLVTEGKGYSFVVFSQKIEDVSEKSLKPIIELHTFAEKNSIPFIFISASGEQTVNELTKQYKIPFKISSMDETTIKTVVRSNPGILLIKDGTIINKWGRNCLPKNWKQQLNEDVYPNRGKWLMYTILLLCIIGSALLQNNKIINLFIKK